MQLRDYQQTLANQAFIDSRKGLFLCVTLFTGGGKCLGKDTPILMYDGTVKPVQDVQAGDLLMGPDSTFRTVLSTCTGQEQLYRVIPKKGDSYIVNESHVLSLRMTPSTDKRYAPDQIVNLSVRDYLAKTNGFRHLAKGWRTGVDFPSVDKVHPNMPPYMLGLWLGDGTQSAIHCNTISKPDTEVLRSVEEYAESVNCFVRTDYSHNGCPSHHVLMKERGRGSDGHSANPMKAALQNLNLVENRHIPHAYKCGSRETRMQVLAGYLDADGFLTHGNGYDTITKVKQLAEDICFVARSLGFAAYTNKQWKACSTTGKGDYYWRISISGAGLEHLPVRLPRRKAEPRRQKKNALRHGIELEKLEIGDYYGFEIDGDHLFMLGDFTVTHNTVIIADIIRQYRELGLEVVVIAHRLEIIKQIAASIRNHTGINPQLITAGHTTPLQPVSVAMIQTLSKRDHWIEALRGRVLIIDEGHHSGSVSYKNLRARLEPQAVIGLTATPIRPNGGTILSPDTFSHLLLGPPPKWLMDQGFICRYDMYGGDPIDTKGLRPRANGEFLEREHEERVLAISGSVVPNWLEFNPKRLSTICIGVTVTHGEQLVQLYRDAGISAALVVGKIKESERARIFREFSEGKINVLVSVALIDEGLDIPSAKCLQLVRSIGSIRLHRQLVGRVMRPTADGERAIIIDHGASWANEKIPMPDEDVSWPLTPKERGTTKRPLGEFTKLDQGGKVIVVNMVETKAPMRLITATARKDLAKGNDLARMSVSERADFFRQQNPVKQQAYNYEQNVIPSLLDSLNKQAKRSGLRSTGGSLARPGAGSSRRPR